MQYQSFRGNDVRQALDKVRAALGPDALIQSTRQVGRSPRGGGGYVEITAGAPRGANARWPFSDGSLEDSRIAPEPRSLPQRKASPKRTSTGGSEELERELLQLRAMLEELNASRPPRERAIALLHAAGIEGALAKDLASGAGRGAKKNREALKQWLTNRIADRLSTDAGLIAKPGPQLIACVGPTGVGKTTTLAKLAAQARLELGRSVSVVSLDNYRVGAVEQWQRYAALMGLPFNATQDPQTFSEIVDASRSEIVLVDTAGRSAHESSQLGACLRRVSGRMLHVLLVLPAWLRAPDAERVVSMYADPRPTALVATKLDETRITGGLLHASLPAGLPFSYLCSGPRVPEDINDASVQAVLGAVFPEN